MAKKYTKFHSRDNHVQYQLLAQSLPGPYIQPYQWAVSYNLQVQRCRERKFFSSGKTVPPTYTSLWHSLTNRQTSI